MHQKSMLKIALLQISPGITLEENLEKGILSCKAAKERGADIALFPEMWSNGYRIYDRDVLQWQAEAIAADGEFVNAFGALAKELNMAIGITLLEKHQNGPRNSLVLFDRFGRRQFVYAKVHTCDFGVERYLTAGEDFYVTSLDTSQGEVKVGVMICYDREFPESARILMLKGAELILVPNACPMEINRLSQLRGRAYENMTAIATCNYPETVPDCNGGSSVFDGVAYLPDLPGSRDTCILQAGGQEEIYVAELDLEQLRHYRRTEVHGNAFRQPTKYNLLVETKKEEPFLREEYRQQQRVEGMRCRTYEAGSLNNYKYVVILSEYQGKILLGQHNNRTTWETQGGHIEPGETPMEAARRELFEESGALEFEITPLCDYWAGTPEDWANGVVFRANITKLGPMPQSEMARVQTFNQLPPNLTYPAITPVLFNYLYRK